MDPPRDEMGNPLFQDLLRYGLHNSNIGTQANEQPGRLVMSQKGPYLADHDVRGATRHLNSYADNGMGRMISQKHRDKNRQLVGKALEDRRELARARITQGGWKAHIAGTAVQYIQKISWKEYTSTMSCVRKLMIDAEELGEFCNDTRAICFFLECNMHKLITFQAMDKDFTIPDYIVRRASQTTLEGALKYRWFRSVIQEFQGLGTGATVFWLRPYRAQSEGIATYGSTSGLDRNGQGVISKEIPVGGHTNTMMIEPGQTTQDVNHHVRARKRARESPEEVNVDDLDTKVKRESTEAIFAGVQDIFEEFPGTCLDSAATSAEVGGDGDGEDKQQAERQTLTVLFHGMGGDDAKESEHVQVYVPRTAKGVTINFL